MNLRRVICAVASVSALMIISLQPAAQNLQDNRHKPHHYELVDLGSTFGGPQSYLVPGSGQDFVGSSVLTGGGTVAGFADTSVSDPFPNFCFSDCFISHAFRAGRGGSLTDLGTLPGGGSSAPIWITANGLIAGVSENGQTDPLYPGGFPEMRAVLWHQGTILDLGTLPEGGYQSEANALNSAGQVVGTALNTTADADSMAAGNYWYFDVPYGYQERAFLWDRQLGMQDLGTLGGTDAEALFINERGQVVGHSYTGSTPSSLCQYPLLTDSFIWEKHTGMVDLGTLGGTCTEAAGLNQKGQVVGLSNLAGDQSQHAFLWSRGSIHDLGGSLGGSYLGAYGVNENGEAAGYAYRSDNTTFHAVLWKGIGQMTDLGVIGDDQCSYAATLNGSGQVVGSSVSSCTAEDPTFRAFLWEDGMMFDLNNLIPLGSPLYLQVVQSINDRGEVAGQGVDSSGNNHAFLLIPCDENHPGVEGCDYNSVDATTAAQAPVPRYLPNGLQHLPQSRRSNRYQFPRRAGATTGTASQITDANAASWVSGNGINVDALDAVEPSNLAGQGLCSEFGGKLTGRCIRSFVWFCVSKNDPVHCPVGQKARNPQNIQCGPGNVGPGYVEVDASRRCNI
jgi:probable HAF family extracellular repeat protein